MRGCKCWQCRRERGLIAPTLVRAFRQEQALAVKRRIQRREIVKLERLVAHRELQAVRAGATRSRRYVATRDRKLAAAVRGLERAKLRMESLA